MNPESEYLISKAISGPFAKHLSISIVEAKAGHAVLKMPICEIHKESSGRVSYGAIVALADTTIGIGARTVMGKGEESATLELQIIHLEQTSTSHLISTSIIRREDNVLIAGTVTVSDEYGNEIAIGQGTFAVFQANQSPTHTKTSAPG
jgi:uncharacterized protein (TIGR00369 family)